MSYNLIFVDVGYGDRFPTYVHKMNVITGDHVQGVTLKGTIREQIDALINIIMRDRPDKIIFDKKQMGMIFYQEFLRMTFFEPAKDVFSVDSFGLISYNDVFGKEWTL